jgi:hypothetical protein
LSYIPSCCSDGLFPTAPTESYKDEKFPSATVSSQLLYKDGSFTLSYAKSFIANGSLRFGNGIESLERRNQERDFSHHSSTPTDLWAATSISGSRAT